MRNLKGTNRLARVLQERITTTGVQPPILELGTINTDLSLTTDRFPISIPKGDYLVGRSLTLKEPLITVQTSTIVVGDHGGHNHSVAVTRPGEMAPLKPGDRVLVAWVNEGTDPVVIDVVETS